MPVEGLDKLEVVQIGIVVRDAQVSAIRYAEVFGVPVPGLFVDKGGDKPRATYRGKPIQGAVQGAAFDMGRIQLELLQPLDTDNVWSDFLNEHGEGIHHVAFATSNTDAAVASFAQYGYSVLQQGMFSDDSGRYTYLDTDKDLGIVIEVMERFGDHLLKYVPPFPQDTGIGTITVTQFAVMVHDIERVSQRWSEVFGIPKPNLIITAGYNVVKTTYKGERSDATAKLAFFNFGQAQLELIEPDTTPSVWRDHLNAKGESGHHIAFNVSSTLGATKYLEKHGIPVSQQGLYGDLSGMYTYMACEELLGASVELLENFAL